MSVHVTAKEAWGVVGTAAAIFVAGLLSGRVLGVGHLIYAFAIPLGILFGWVGALGFAVGSLLRDLTLGTAGPSSVVLLVGDLLLVAFGVAIWGGRALPARHDRTRELLVDLWAYESSAVIASLWSIAFVASGMTFLGGTAFGNGVAALALDRAVPVTLLGPFVLLALASAHDRRPANPHASFRPAGRTLIAVLLVAVAWVGGGLALDLVRRDVASLPGAGADLVAYIPDWFGPVALFAIGPLYPVVQMALAVIALVAGLVLIGGERGMAEENTRRHRFRHN